MISKNDKGLRSSVNLSRRLDLRSHSSSIQIAQVTPKSRLQYLGPAVTQSLLEMSSSWLYPTEGRFSCYSHLPYVELKYLS